MKRFTMIDVGRHITLYQNLKQFAFQIAYSYEEKDEYEHLFWITIAFWQIEFAWTFNFAN